MASDDVEHVRALIARCAREGNHTGRSRELLATILESLRQAYDARAAARRSCWLRPRSRHASHQRQPLTSTALLAGAPRLADARSLDPPQRQAKVGHNGRMEVPVSVAHAIATHLPCLRRFARALTGNQKSGD